MRAEILRSWLRTRRAMALSPRRLEAHRARQWARLQPALARTPALADYAGGPLEAFPITDPAEIRADYGRWNSLGLSDAQLRAMADGQAPGAISVGWSSGSGEGRRGLFVTDAAERADYIGQSLARLLPARALLRRQRLGLWLRAGNDLYSDVGTGRFAFAHFPLEAGAAQIAGFAPTILVAPPHRLLALEGPIPTLRHIFYGSEPMSAAEQAHVAARTGLVPQPIYQATEGFIAAACRHGRLHLNDHALEIALEPVAGTPGFRAIVTDLRRRSQPIVRVRTDDYLELAEEPCPCGYAGRIIAPVAGRVSDLWPLPGRIVTPPWVVAAVEAEIAPDWRWQATASPRGIVLRTDPDCPADRAERAAGRLRAEAGAPVAVSRDLPPWPGPKRRKMIWSDG